MPPAEGQNFISIAVTYGNDTNDADAEVENGASVNAGGSITVSTNTAVPYSLPWSSITPTPGGLQGAQIMQFILQELGSDLGVSGFFTTFTQTQARGHGHEPGRFRWASFTRPTPPLRPSTPGR